jgi:hypothetical protein
VSTRCQHDISRPDNTITGYYERCSECVEPVTWDKIQQWCFHRSLERWGRGYGLRRCTDCKLVMDVVIVPASGVSA